MTVGQLKHKLSILEELRLKYSEDEYVLDRIASRRRELIVEIGNLERCRAEQIIFNALREKGLE